MPPSDGPTLRVADKEDDDLHSLGSVPTLVLDGSHKRLESSGSATSSIFEKLGNDHRALSTLRLCIVHIGAALTLFLATTDATIVSTSLPTIVSHLRASKGQYTWVAVAYMLTQTAFQPLYGRLSELLGRKHLLYSSMAIFSIGSLLCGSAQTIEWLIAARAIAGIGGGGIVSSVWVITAEIVEVKNRAKWSQVLSITWSCSAIAGPLLGGVFSGGNSLTSVSWRWAFYINIPICIFACFVLWPSLRGVPLGTSHTATWRDFGEKFDFLGLILFMAGSGCIIVGFSFATELGWTTPSMLCLVILGFAILLCAGIYEVNTTRDAIFPTSMFKNRNVVLILVVNFLHNFAFNAGTFYLALYFQAVNDTTPLISGMMLLPYSLGSSLASMPAAWFIGLWQKRAMDTSGQNLVITIGAIISTLGFSMLIALHEHSPKSLQAIFPLVAGIGLGMLFHAPYQVFTRAVTSQQLATGTSAFFLVRFTGATTGLAVAGAVFYARLSDHMYSAHKLPLTASLDLSWLKSLEPLALKRHMLHVVASSIQTIWIVCTPCLCLAFAMSVFLRRLPIEEAGEDRSSTDKGSSGSTERTNV